MKIFVSNDISEKGVALLREHFDVDVMPNMKPEELIKVCRIWERLRERLQGFFEKNIFLSRKNAISLPSETGDKLAEEILGYLLPLQKE